MEVDPVEQSAVEPGPMTPEVAGRAAAGLVEVAGAATEAGPQRRDQPPRGLFLQPVERLAEGLLNRAAESREIVEDQNAAAGEVGLSGAAAAPEQAGRREGDTRGARTGLPGGGTSPARA